jgi:hypothetical protein
MILLCWPAVLRAQNAFGGTWKTATAKYPFGLGAVAISTLSADGREHFSNNGSREYDFAIDGKEYPTDRPGSTVVWTKTGQSTFYLRRENSRKTTKRDTSGLVAAWRNTRHDLRMVQSRQSNRPRGDPIQPRLRRSGPVRLMEGREENRGT